MSKIGQMVIVVVFLLWMLPTDAWAMLHPQQGRFIQRDPLGYVDGMGLYEYVKSRSIRAMDFTGLKHNEKTLMLPPSGRSFTCDCEQPDPPGPGKPPEPCKFEDLKKCPEKSSCAQELAQALQKESVKNLLAKIKTMGGSPITIECRTCTGGCKDAGAWHFSGNSAGIYICDGQQFNGDLMETYLLHELTHELQAVRNDPDVSCLDRMKMEMEAYMSDPGASFEDAVKGAVWSSCYAMRCGPDDIKQELIGKLYDMWKASHP